MSKKQRRSIEQLLNLVLVGTGLVVWFFVFSSSWIALFSFIIGGVLLTQIIMLFIPGEKKKDRKPPVKTTKTKTKNSPHNRLLPDEKILSLPLEELSWREFERLCYLYYKAKGYNPVETKQGADGGIDLIITDPHYKERAAIQIKHYINSGREITVKEIRELDSAKKNEKCMLADFITSSRFTNPALVEADDRHIQTRDIYWVRDNIDKWRKKQLISN